MGSCVSQPADGSQVHLAARGANMSWGNNDVKASGGKSSSATRPHRPPGCPTPASANSTREPRFHSKVDSHTPASTQPPSPRPPSAGAASTVSTSMAIVTSQRPELPPPASQDQHQQQQQHEAGAINAGAAETVKEKTTGADMSSDGDGDGGGDGGGGGSLKRKDSKNASMQTDTMAKLTTEGGSTKEKKKKSLIRKGKVFVCLFCFVCLFVCLPLFHFVGLVCLLKEKNVSP